MHLLSEPVPDDVRVGPDFYLAPLVPLLGRGNGAIVAVVDRERGLLFVLRDSRLEPLADLSEEAPGKHDQGGWSQARFQRHIEELVRDHLRTVADDLDKHLRSGIARHVVIVGPEEARSDFMGLLSHDAAAAVVGATSGEGYATPNELLELALPFVDKARLAEETAIVERWQEEAGRHGRAAVGWDQTLESASTGASRCCSSRRACGARRTSARSADARRRPTACARSTGRIWKRARTASTLPSTGRSPTAATCTRSRASAASSRPPTASPRCFVSSPRTASRCERRGRPAGSYAASALRPGSSSTVSPSSSSTSSVACSSFTANLSSRLSAR